MAPVGPSSEFWEEMDLPERVDEPPKTDTVLGLMRGRLITASQPSFLYRKAAFTDLDKLQEPWLKITVLVKTEPNER